MKNSKNQSNLGKLNLEKLQITKLKNANLIIGGNALNNNEDDDLSLPTWTKADILNG